MFPLEQFGVRSFHFRPSGKESVAVDGVRQGQRNGAREETPKELFRALINLKRRRRNLDSKIQSVDIGNFLSCGEKVFEVVVNLIMNLTRVFQARQLRNFVANPCHGVSMGIEVVKYVRCSVDVSESVRDIEAELLYVESPKMKFLIELVHEQDRKEIRLVLTTTSVDFLC